jgi:hypothetical protein
MAQPNSTQAVSSTRFPELLPEIRLMSWEYSLPSPRVINVYVNRSVHFPGCPRHFEPSHEHVYLNKTPVPAILHACYDSRTVGLKHYQLILDSNELEDRMTFHKGTVHEVCRALGHPGTKSPVYVDLDQDVLVPYFYLVYGFLNREYLDDTLKEI